MAEILLGALILEGIVLFFLNGKNVFSPSIIACAVFIVSALMFLIGKDYYAYELSSVTVLIILLFIFCIFIGEFIVGLTVRKKEYVKLEESAKPIVLPVYVCVLLAAFVLVIGILYFKSVYNYSLKVGNKAGNYFGMARYVRKDGKYQSGIFLSQTTLICECLLMFFVYSFIYNRAVIGKFFYRYLIIVPPFAIHLLAIDDRTTLLRSVIMALAIVVFLIKQRDGWTNKHDKFIALFGLIALAVYLVIFIVLGQRMKGGGSVDAGDEWENVIKYTSSGLVGLDKYLTNEIKAMNEIFAQNTLLYVYKFLISVGFMNLPTISTHDTFFYFDGGNSNIYTGLKDVIVDFNLLGAVLIFIMIGMLFGAFLNAIRLKKVTFVRVSLLALFLFPIAMLSIDCCIATVLSVTTLYMLFYYYGITVLANLFRVKKYDDKIFWRQK